RNLPPVVDSSELHFELLNQRVAAAVEIGDPDELSGGRLRIRHGNLEFVHLEIRLLQAGAGRGECLSNVVRTIEPAGVQPGDIHLQDGIRTEVTGQLVRTGDLEDRIFV